MSELDVGRLQVAMNDAAFVRGFESFGDLLGDGQGFFERDGALLDAFGESGAFD